MNLPDFTYESYFICSNCNKREATYVSNICLHRLCATCYSNIFPTKNSEYTCKFCGEGSKILREENFDPNKSDKFLYKKDISIRNILLNNIINKTKENFESLEDYNLYITEFEDLVEQCLSKPIEIKEILSTIKKRRYKTILESQEKSEREHNVERLRKEIEKISVEFKNRDPFIYYSNKIHINIDDDEKDGEINDKSNPVTFNYFHQGKEFQKPIYVEKGIIQHNHNEELRRKAGGYDVIGRYRELGMYYKCGF